MPPPDTSQNVPGLPARLAAAQLLHAVLRQNRPLDQMLDAQTGLAELATLDERDRALVHMLVAKTLRRLGTLRALLAALLERGLPNGAHHLEVLLLLGAAQILFLDVKDHAAVDLAVRLANRHRTTRRYAGLVNAVLRRVTREGRERIAGFNAAIDTPVWLMNRWTAAYGSETASAIVDAHRNEPSLDLTAKSDAADWAKKLGAALLPTGSIRLAETGQVSSLAGFDDGAWWVQDAAAALPVRLLGDIAGRSVADLCAALGGKTAQLLAAGATVTAVDRSAPRLRRLRANLQRLRLAAEVVEADASTWSAGPFDAVLLDAPCSATGTIRRNPDLPWQRQPADLARLTHLQGRLLDNAAHLVRAGGLLVYATCSLESEECEQQIERFLACNAGWKREAIRPAEIGGDDSLLSMDGDLRTLPCHLPNQNPRLSGCDGFYAARLHRLA